MAFAEAFIVFSVVFLGGVAAVLATLYGAYQVARFAALSAQRAYASITAQPAQRTFSIPRSVPNTLRSRPAHRAVASMTGSHSIRIA